MPRCVCVYVNAYMVRFGFVRIALPPFFRRRRRLRAGGKKLRDTDKIMNELFLLLLRYCLIHRTRQSNAPVIARVSPSPSPLSRFLLL